MKSNATRCGNVSATEPQRDPRRPVYKNIIAFCADDRWSPLQTLCGIIFLDCRGRASIFALQIDGPKNRTCTWQAASLLCKLAVEHSETGMRTERSNTSNVQQDPSVVGEPLPRLFSPITVEKRFDRVSVLQNTLACSNISTLRSG